MVGSGQPAAMVLCTLSEQASGLNPELLATTLLNLLNEVNQKVEHHEQLARIIICKEEWTIQNELLTPTLKIKRKNIDARYSSQYADWYKAESIVIFE
ncbi:hypothetical protein D3C72_2163830 [compost metagenome]